MEMLADEAMKDGLPLTEADKEILVAESVKPIPEVLRQRAGHLITRILEREPADEDERDQKCFSYALQWAADGRYPNIVALGREVASDMRPAIGLHGWRLLKDRLYLVGCGLLVVFLMMAIIGSCSGWK
jgi:hypothetical protein